MSWLRFVRICTAFLVISALNPLSRSFLQYFLCPDTVARHLNHCRTLTEGGLRAEHVFKTLTGAVTLCIPSAHPVQYVSLSGMFVSPMATGRRCKREVPVLLRLRKWETQECTQTKNVSNLPQIFPSRSAAARRWFERFYLCFWPHIVLPSKLRGVGGGRFYMYIFNLLTWALWSDTLVLIPANNILRWS